MIVMGGGFAGVEAARHLRRRFRDGWDIFLFSQENHFVFTPLIGEVIGASINPLHIVWPMRQMLPGVSCRTATVTHIDLKEKKVFYKTASGQPTEQRYDHLILACGLSVNLDVIPGMAAHGWPLKSLGDAVVLRNHLIGCLEEAEVETDPGLKRQLLSFVVVGGGFSGVDVAGEVRDLLLESARFYPNVNSREIRVTLLQVLSHILPELPESLSRFATRQMQARGIEIKTRTEAKAVTPKGVWIDGREFIEARTVVCTIGNAINPLIRSMGLPLEKHRIKTEADFRVQGYNCLWALGDCAAVPNAHDGTISPPTAQLAVRQARQLAANLARYHGGIHTIPFCYKPLGMFASIGHHRAVGQLLGVNFAGFLAWFLWRGIYLSKMPTLARKVQIAFDWAWNLFFPRDIVQLKVLETERWGRAHFEAGERVFEKGDPGDRFYMILKGRAGVYLNPSEPPVVTLRPGDHFGEGELLSGGRRSASVKAEDALDVLTVDQTSFSQLLRSLRVLQEEVERSAQKGRSILEFAKVVPDDANFRNLRARDVMRGPVMTLSINLTFEDALRRSLEGGKGGYPVLDASGKMVGICTRSDFYRAFRELRPPDTSLSQIMRAPVITALANEPLSSVVMRFLQEPIKRMVIVREEAPDTPIGMVTPFDILPILSIRAATRG